MKNIYSEERQQSLQLKKHISSLIYNQLKENMNPYWFISFHYTSNKTKDDEIIRDVGDLKNKIRRIAYKNRDRCITGAGLFPYPKMLFFNEKSHLGTGQFHTHLIMEKMPSHINTQTGIENLFIRLLPSKVKTLSKWKSVDIQRILCEDQDLRRLSNYLSKQFAFNSIAFDAFNSDLNNCRPTSI
jgi:hypothetical protein